ncbi:MAG: hypothetical protein KAI47_01720, partial [Deltaproteobacteria bacterium]|nr:hypothetical protein [Deltaproteobacteria bacterium]
MNTFLQEHRFSLGLVTIVMGAGFALAACQQDPYRYLQGGDGGGKDFSDFVDGVAPLDGGFRDAR